MEIRVLHIITRLIVGGAQENTLLTVIGQTRTPGLRVTLLSGIDDGPEGNLHERASAEGVDLKLMKELVRPVAPVADALALARLVAFIRNGRYDVVHTHSSKAGILGRVAAKLAGTPIVVHTLHSLVFGEHGSAFTNRLYVFLKRLCAPLTHKIISVSEATRQGALAAGIGRPEQHLTIYSGFPLQPFLSIRDQLSAAEAKKRLGLEPEHLVVGKVARLFAQKGHDYFLSAAALVARQEPRARFLVVGGGPLRSLLEQRAFQLGIGDRLIWTGLVGATEVPALVQAMDVLVHTSVREGLARVIPQAMVVGKPVVAFALDGTPEVVRDGLTGFLARPRDSAEVATRVLELLKDETRRQALGEAGRQFASAHFSVETMLERIGQVYAQLVREHLPHKAPLTMNLAGGAPHLGLARN